MARKTTVALNDSEKSQLSAVRQTLFGTDEVPYGVVITRLIDDFTDSSVESDTDTQSSNATIDDHSLTDGDTESNSSNQGEQQ